LDKENVDFEFSKNQVIVQVVEFGTLKDWELLQQLYDRDVLKQTLQNARSLDKIILAFLSVYFNTAKSAFRCFNQNASTTNFWNS